MRVCVCVCVWAGAGGGGGGGVKRGEGGRGGLGGRGVNTGVRASDLRSEVGSFYLLFCHFA